MMTCYGPCLNFSYLHEQFGLQTEIQVHIFFDYFFEETLDPTTTHYHVSYNDCNWHLIKCSTFYTVQFSCTQSTGLHTYCTVLFYHHTRLRCTCHAQVAILALRPITPSTSVMINLSCCTVPLCLAYSSTSRMSHLTDYNHERQRWSHVVKL